MVETPGLHVGLRSHHFLSIIFFTIFLSLDGKMHLSASEAGTVAAVMTPQDTIMFLHVDIY